MSVKAYIIREKTIYVDEKNKTVHDTRINENLVKYTHEDQEYCFDIWRQEKLLESLLDYGAEDYTNDQFLGTIEIGLDDFEAFDENTYWEDESDQESINKIRKYFEDNYWLILKCY